VKRNVTLRFRNKKREYLTQKIQEIEENGKTNNTRDLYKGVNSLRKGYQPRLGMIRNERGDPRADSTKIIDAWKNYFDLLNVQKGEPTEEFEIYTAEPWIAEPSEIEVQMSIKKLKHFKSPGTDIIPAKLIKAGGTALDNELHKFIGAIWRKEELPKE